VSLGYARVLRTAGQLARRASGPNRASSQWISDRGSEDAFVHGIDRVGILALGEPGIAGIAEDGRVVDDFAERLRELSGELHGAGGPDHQRSKDPHPERVPENLGFNGIQ
jgi:hypothetical protein